MVQFQNITVNPFTGAAEGLPESELSVRMEKTTALLRELDLDAAIFDLAREGNERWFRNVPVIGSPSSAYFVVSRAGVGYVSGGYSLDTLEKKAAHFLNPLTSGRDVEETTTLAALCGTSGRIGCIEPEKLRVPARDTIARETPHAELVDISVPFRTMKAVKTDVDLDFLRLSASQHDRVMEAVPAMLTVGREEPSVVSEIRYKCYANGASGFSIGRLVRVRMISAPQGEPVPEGPVSWPGRELRQGDAVTISLQSVGIGGYFGSIGRTFVLGEAAAGTRRAWQAALEAHRAAVSALVPGATLAAARDAARDAAASAGFTLQNTMCLSGVGCAMFEPPVLTPSMETMELKEGMVIAVGPEIAGADGFPFLCQDVYRIGAGGAQRLSRLDQVLFER